MTGVEEERDRLKLQLIKIPIRDWNAVIPCGGTSFPSLQLIKIPIRDWNLDYDPDFPEYEIAINQNPY